MLLSCLVVALWKTSSRPHSSVVCRCHQDDLSRVALGTECLPITIFSRKIWMKNTLLYLLHIPKRVGFLGHRVSFGHIFQVSFVHSWQMSSAQPRLARNGHWTSPSCNTLCVDLNKRYLIISSAHPNWCRFPWLSKVSCTHLPILILPYLADVISTTWPFGHCALNVSQLQYSLWRSKFRNTLLYLPHILFHGRFLSCHKFLPRIFQTSFFHIWQTSSAQPDPPGSEHWKFPSCNTLYGDLNKKYLIIFSIHPISCSFPAPSYDIWTHLPNLILPYFADVISTTSFGSQWALNVSQLQYSLCRSK